MTCMTNMTYCGAVLQQLDNQRKSERFCDVKIVAGDGAEFPAHKGVLAAVSPFFAGLLLAPSSQNRPVPGRKTQELTAAVHLKNTDAKSVGLVLDFIYSGKLCVDSGDFDWQVVKNIATKCHIGPLRNLFATVGTHNLQHLNSTVKLTALLKQTFEAGMCAMHSVLSCSQCMMDGSSQELSDKQIGLNSALHHHQTAKVTQKRGVSADLTTVPEPAPKNEPIFRSPLLAMNPEPSTSTPKMLGDLAPENQETPFSCKFCHRTYSSSAALMRHSGRVHAYNPFRKFSKHENNLNSFNFDNISEISRHSSQSPSLTSRRKPLPRSGRKHRRYRHYTRDMSISYSGSLSRRKSSKNAERRNRGNNLGSADSSLGSSPSQSADGRKRRSGKSLDHQELHKGRKRSKYSLAPARSVSEAEVLRMDRSGSRDHVDQRQARSSIRRRKDRSDRRLSIIDETDVRKREEIPWLAAEETFALDVTAPSVSKAAGITSKPVASVYPLIEAAKPQPTILGSPKSGTPFVDSGRSSQSQHFSNEKDSCSASDGSQKLTGSDQNRTFKHGGLSPNRRNPKQNASNNVRSKCEGTLSFGASNHSGFSRMGDSMMLHGYNESFSGFLQNPEYSALGGAEISKLAAGSEFTSLSQTREYGWSKSKNVDDQHKSDWSKLGVSGHQLKADWPESRSAVDQHKSDWPKRKMVNSQEHSYTRIVKPRKQNVRRDSPPPPPVPDVLTEDEDVGSDRGEATRGSPPPAPPPSEDAGSVQSAQTHSDLITNATTAYYTAPVGYEQFVDYGTL